jgi:hypothetical protein
MIRIFVTFFHQYNEMVLALICFWFCCWLKNAWTEIKWSNISGIIYSWKKNLFGLDYIKRVTQRFLDNCFWELCGYVFDEEYDRSGLCLPNLIIRLISCMYGHVMCHHVTYHHVTSTVQWNVQKNVTSLNAWKLDWLIYIHQYFSSWKIFLVSCSFQDICYTAHLRAKIQCFA